MKFRKLFTMLFLAFVALCLVACGDKPADTPSDNPGDNPGENPGGDPGENPGENPGGETEDVEAKVKGYVESIAITYAEGDSKDSVTKNVTLNKVEAEGLTITWASDNAAITNEGVVTRGDQDVTVKLTVTGTYKEKTYSVDFTLVVKALVKVSSITVKGASEVETGAESTYAVEVLPADAANKEVAWSTSDESVATIDEAGKLTTLKAGTVKVVATAKDGSEVKGELEVTVADPLPTEAVTIEAAKAQADDTYAYIEGVVVAVTTRGYVLRDATGVMYVYAYGSSVDLEKNFFYEEGESIFVIGKLGTYNGRQIVPVSSDYALEEVVLEEVRAEEIDAAALDAYVAKPGEGETKEYANKLVALTGKLAVTENNGKKYYNIVVEGTTNQGSISYITDEWAAKYEDGQTYTFYGYTVGHSSNKYMNIALCNYEPPLPDLVEVYTEGGIYVNSAFTAESCSWGGHALTYGTDGFDKLEAAIDAAPDYSTIYLASGEYLILEGTEAKTIDKHLTFVGPNAEIAGYAKKRYPEAIVKFPTNNIDVMVGKSLTFVGVDIVGNGSGYVAGVKLQGTDTTEGVVMLNCLIENANTWFKIQKAVAGAKFYVEGCKVHGVGQFFCWLTVPVEFTFVNNVFDATDCGAVGNSAAALFRIRGANIVAKFYGNTFVGDEAESNPGWFEFDGEGTTADVQYNIFNMSTRFFYWHAGQTPAAVNFNKNVVTDGDNAVTENPTGITEPGSDTVTVGTDTFADVDALAAAYAADDTVKVKGPSFAPVPVTPTYDLTITGKVYGVGSSSDTPNTSYFNTDAEANFLYVVDKATCAAQSSTFGYACRIGITYDAEKGCYVVDKIFTTDNTEAIKDATSDFVLMYHSSYNDKANMDTIKVGDMIYANFEGLTAGPIDVQMGVVRSAVIPA